MPDLVQCPFFRKEHEDTIRCEMCEKWFPGRAKKVRWWKQYCICDWKSCPNAIGIIEVYESEGPMFIIRKLQFELNRSREEVKQMSRFIKTKKEQLKEQMGINKGLVDRIARLETLQRANPELMDRQKLQDALNNQRMENKALHIATEQIKNNLTAIAAYTAFKTGLTEIPVKEYLQFSQEYEVGFDFPQDMATKVQQGTLTQEDVIAFKFKPVEVEEDEVGE